MKPLYLTLLLVLVPLLLHAQTSLPDSLEYGLKNAPNGFPKYKATRLVYTYFEELNRDSALYYANQLVAIAKSNNHKLGEAYGMVSAAYQLQHLGRLAEAFQNLLQAFEISKDPESEKGENWDVANISFTGNQRLLTLSAAHHMFAILMMKTDNVEQQIYHFKESERIAKIIGDSGRVMTAKMNLGSSYLTINKPDSALYFEKEAERIALEINYTKYLGNVNLLLGDIYQALENKPLALQYYYEGIQSSLENNNRNGLFRNYSRLNKYHLDEGNKDSALFYATKNLQIIQTLGSVTGADTHIGVAYENLYLSYKLQDQFDSAFKYQGLALMTKDSLYNSRIKNLTEFQNLTLGEQLRLQNLEKEKVIYENKIRTYALLSGLGVFLLIGLSLYRNNRNNQKANKILETTLTHLKSTQAQLIQSEKMASLGELTAGIAHEIQNPLNFVNNFSELNKELVEEANVELGKGDIEEIKAILKDLGENSEKITFHGKRADAIVKGMLEHSRANKGEKALTDLNALADEFVRLSYHGLRAKDKSFNADFKLDLDPNLPKVNVAAADIGRVILNLVNNAFYAVNEKAKSTPQPSRNIGTGSEEGDVYKPIVTVRTTVTKSPSGDLGIQISVQDNGPGIPDQIKEKIFQPFFTTKPTGSGTGLGLSLSYDIVKAHGGEILIESQVDIGTEFKIRLPKE